jgi:antitoxin HicB
MPTRFAYPVDLKPDRDGGFVVSFPDLPEALTSGNDRADALAEASDCLEEALASRIADKEPIPLPSPARGRPLVAPGAVIAAKAALHTALRESGLTNVAFAASFGCQENEVRRMLDPRHATKIGRLEEALARLGKRLIVTVEAA